MKDAGNVGYTIDQFNLKFLELKDFEEPSLDSQIKVLSEVVEKSKTKMSPPQIYSSEDVPAFIKSTSFFFFFSFFLFFFFSFSFSFFSLFSFLLM